MYRARTKKARPRRPRCSRMPRQACRTPRRWRQPRTNPKKGTPSLTEREFFYPIFTDGLLIEPALFDIAGGGPHDQVGEVTVADKSQHLGVLLGLDRVGRGL